MTIMPSMMMLITTNDEAAVEAESNWVKLPNGILKAELKRRSVFYQELADKLAQIGVRETPQNIANKISRGGYGRLHAPVPQAR